MAAPDMDVIKEIPGYKVILKAVLKAQIQQLVEQLASHTEEDSIILTASVHDGTLSHLGSESGKAFLEDHDDVKSQFLGHCLKYHHKKRQEKECEEREEAMRQAAAAQYAARPSFMPNRSPRQPPPRFMGARHPLRSPNARPQPYPVTRPVRLPVAVSTPSSMKSPNKLDGQVIKIEPDDSNDESSNQGVSESNIHGTGAATPTSVQSPSHSNPPSTPSKLKTESEEKDDDAISDSSNSTIPNESSAEGLSLESDLSRLISDQTQQQSQQGSKSGEIDPDVSVKLEALTESEMELEITGVEPGRPAMPQDNWDPNVSMGMNFDPTGATGSAGDMAAQGYSPEEMGTYEWTHGTNTNDELLELAPGTLGSAQLGSTKLGKQIYQCNVCAKVFTRPSHIERHMRSHTGEKPFKCIHCGRGFSEKCNLKVHMVTHLKDQIDKTMAEQVAKKSKE